ncbi:MAG: hypothetical protein ACYDHY_14865 [Acidiferrobacterales bacterium]
MRKQHAGGLEVLSHLALDSRVDGIAFVQAKAAGATHLVARGKLVEKVLARIAGGG